MRIAIVGTGAMGTLIGHGLCDAGYEVTVLDQPSRIAQLQSAGGLDVVTPEGNQSTVCPTLATSDYSEAGVHDVIFLATKSQDLPAVAERVSDLIKDTSTVVTIQNGIPWWYFQGLETDYGVSRIQCLDPEGSLERAIDAALIVGCVAYPAAMIDAAGQVKHVEGLRFPVGELDGSVRKRTRVLAGIFEDAGFKSRVIDDIRSEIWLKAWGAVAINPISALTRATMVDICSFPATRELVARMMREVQDVADAFGARFRHTMEKRIEGAKAVGAHKTSMLQDVECNRALELDALMLAVIELAEIADKRVPTIRNIYACTALLNENLLDLQDRVSRNQL